MQLPGSWLVLEEVESTQVVAATLVAEGKRETAAVFGHDQLAGKGRFGRNWVSRRGESLTFSFILWTYADWPRPWLIGMSVAIAVAEAMGCRLRWPNDLSWEGLKAGGILTELFSDPQGRRVPVVGIGVNLRQERFPPELPFATSILLATGRSWEPMEAAHAIVAKLGEVPDPVKWDDIEAQWLERDATPGKKYRLSQEEEGVAVRLAGDGSLVCNVDGQEREVLAAEALFFQ